MTQERMGQLPALAAATMTATSACGDADSPRLEPQPRIVSYWVDPEFIDLGETAQISWAVENASD
ncbi:MAG: hypothetical protein HC923_11410, partial [Myxococcales bacterium]|nr:hypothetical protein [Myxococcales bacterium]